MTTSLTGISGSTPGPGPGRRPALPRRYDVRALTLPGQDTATTPRHSLTLEDHLQAMVDGLTEHSDRPAVVVGHSDASPVDYAGTDRALTSCAAPSTSAAGACRTGVPPT